MASKNEDEQLELFDNDMVELRAPKHPVESYRDNFPGIDNPFLVEASACTLGEYLERCSLQPTILDDVNEPGYLMVMERFEDIATVAWMPADEFEEQFDKVSETIH